MYKSIHYICYLLVLLAPCANAQIKQSNRIEINLMGTESGYSIIPVAEHGVVLFREIYIRQQYLLDIQLFDTDFNKTWSGYLPVDDGLHLSDFDVYEGNIGFLFSPNNIQAMHMEIIYMRSSDGKYNYYMVDNPLPVYQSGFKLTRFGALIGGNYNDRPLVYFFDYSTQKSNILPGFFNEPGDLIQIQTYEDSSYEIITRGNHLSVEKTLWIKYYSPLGILLKSSRLESVNNDALLSGRSIMLPGRNQIIAGTFGNVNSEKSKGIFTISVDEAKNQEIKYYKYSELQNFFSYMKEAKQEKLQDKIQRKRINGKNIRFKYRLMLNEIIEYNDQLVLIGHAYFPHYNRSSSLYRQPTVRQDDVAMPYYGLLTNTNQVLQNYKSTHAVIIGIGRDGKLLWDNSFEINDVLSYKLVPFVKSYHDKENDRINLLYLYNNQISTKIIQKNKVVSGKRYDPLRLSLQEDEIIRNLDSGVGGLNYWHDKYFLAHGIQTIRNKSGIGPKYRRVFFLNKISYN
jgi:hypothetical protein